MDHDKIDQQAFELFAELYPHEAYEAYPGRFLTFALARCPHLSREVILQILNETSAEWSVGMDKDKLDELIRRDPGQCPGGDDCCCCHPGCDCGCRDVCPRFRYIVSERLLKEET